nr:MAG TPA: hypothetical protein [Caudoviricetes sp.]
MSTQSHAQNFGSQNKRSTKMMMVKKKLKTISS